MISRKRITPILFILILSLVSIPPFVECAGYGEENESLGQFTDDFESLDNVTVIDDLIRNSTLNCIELNMSIPSTLIYNLTSLREHDYYGGAFVVAVTYSIANNDELREYSSTGSLGRGYIFLTVNSAWLDDKYVRFRWYPYSSIGPGKYSWFQVWDGDYDRSSNVDFPAGAVFLSKGNGELYNQRALSANAWETLDNQVDTSGGSEDNVTLFFAIYDAWADTSIGCWLDWIEINDGAGGADNIITINYNNSSPITMEQLGTEGDYGFSLSPELPFYSVGYETDGYFITENYLNYTDGNALVQLTNASIPSGTSLTVQFSNDNSTWVDHEGNVGSTSIGEGFYSIDLRDLNYSAIYQIYNFTGQTSLTPRLYQSRLVTTEGAGVIITYESDFPCIAIAIILSLLAGLLVWMKFGDE